MREITKIRRRARSLKTLAMHAVWSVALSIAVLLLPAGFTAPARNLFLQPGGPLLDTVYDASGDLCAAYGTLREAMLAREAVRLSRQQLLEMENRTILLGETLRDIQDRVRDYEALEIVAPQVAALSAGVISYDAGPGRVSIAIAAGAGRGIEGGEAVVAAGAAVGTVTQAGRYYSRVLLLTDPASSIPVRSMRTGTLYVLSGLDGIRCVLEMTEKTADIREGDRLVTVMTPDPGGHLPIVPAGIPVARVTSVDADRRNPLFFRVHAEPMVNLHRLEQVIVLTKPE